MARRRRRSYGAVTSLSLDQLPLIGESVKAADVLVGAALGVAGAAVAKFAIKKFVPADISAKIPAAVMPLVAGISSAAILYFVNDKLLKDRTRGVGHAVGATGVGIALAVSDMLKGKTFLGVTFDDVVSLNMGGLLVDDRKMPMPSGYSGLLVSDTSNNLSQLGAMDMNLPDDGGDGGLAALAQM